MRLHHQVPHAGPAGESATDRRAVLRQIGRSNDSEILAGPVRPAPVHLLLSVPPPLAPSRVLPAMKGKSAPSLLPERRSLRQEFWGQHLGARGYRVCASGNVTEEMSAEYLRPQGAEPQADVRLKVSA